MLNVLTTDQSLVSHGGEYFVPGDGEIAPGDGHVTLGDGTVSPGEGNW